MPIKCGLRARRLPANRRLDLEPLIDRKGQTFFMGDAAASPTCPYASKRLAECGLTAEEIAVHIRVLLGIARCVGASTL